MISVWPSHQITYYLSLSDISDIKDVANPLSKVKVGLSGDGDERIPLKSVHIRAKLVDLPAKVCRTGNMLTFFKRDQQMRIIYYSNVLILFSNYAICCYTHCYSTVPND